MHTITAGDRFRRVTLLVSFADGRSHRITRRYAWTGVNPEHMCSPDVCETCASGAIRTASRRLTDDQSRDILAEATATVQLVQDSQTTSR